MNQNSEGRVWARLEDCVNILDGKRVPINASEREKRIIGKSQSELYPYYGATGQVGWIDDFLFDEELVLLGEDGVSFLDSLRPKSYIVKGKYWVNNHAHVLRALLGVTTNKFLSHYLNIFDYKDYVTGTTRLKLNQSRMKQISIPLPPLPEQHKIVEKIEELFTKLDVGVEALKKVKEQIKQYRQSVLKSAFEGKLTADWRQRMLNDELRVLNEKEELKIDNSELKELPELPEGWVWKRIENISRKIHYGYTAKSNKSKVGPKFLRITDIQNNTVNWNDVPYCQISDEDKEKYLLENRDIVFARTGATVGKSFLIRNIVPEAIFASYLIRIILNDDINGKYLFYFFDSNFYWRQIYSGVSGIGQPNFNATKLSQLIFPFPPLPEQHKIVEEIEKRFSIADEVEKTVDKSLEQAEELRQSILKKAFKGKLTEKWREQHPELISGENSAEKLLEKIKEEKAKLK